jgi:superfamily II DNA or RNA helicase
MSWGVYAHQRAQVTGLGALYGALESCYEALRILVNTWEEGEDLVVQFLRMMNICDPVRDSFYSSSTHAVVISFFAEKPTSYERFDRLVETLAEKRLGKKRKMIGDNAVAVAVASEDKFRGIVFVRQRVTAHILEHFLQSNDAACSLNLRPTIMYSSSSPATPSLARSGAQSRQSLDAFRNGTCNLLIATSVAEEGVDVPEANCVIYFDPIDTSVSYVQGRGRARQDNSSFVMLAERVDRPAVLLAQMELEQHAVASTFQPVVLDSKNTEHLLTAQKSRETGASSLLLDAVAWNKAPTSVLNLYCKKTKAHYDEMFAIMGSKHSCALTYETISRRVVATVEGVTKKEAKNKAALKVLEQLSNAAKNN